jgi:hypothetical protein
MPEQKLKPEKQGDYWQGPMVWAGEQLEREKIWRYQLNDTEIALLAGAVEHSFNIDKPLADINRTDFELGDLGEQLDLLNQEVLNGRGFVLVNGLPVDEWNDDQLIRAFWIIGSWLGQPVPQNARADLLGHVIDQRSPDTTKRLYQTNQEQPLHSDSCDIVGLLCLQQAKQGGESIIASSANIYNVLQAEQPNALRALEDEFPCDRFGEIPAGKQPWYKLRVFNEVNGRLVCCGMDPDIRSAQRLEDVPPLSAERIAALDAFQAIAHRDALRMMLQRGDMQFANNHIVIHARLAFEDYPEADRRRHLIRLWLSAPQGRKLPKLLEERWGNIEVGTVRGGILVPGAVPAVNFEP